MKTNNTNYECLSKRINENNEYLMKKTLHYLRNDKGTLCMLGSIYVGACTLAIYGILKIEDFLQMMIPFD